jgi:hypothetical protein
MDSACKPVLAGTFGSRAANASLTAILNQQWSLINGNVRCCARLKWRHYAIFMLSIAVTIILFAVARPGPQRAARAGLAPWRERLLHQDALW